MVLLVWGFCSIFPLLIYCDCPPSTLSCQSWEKFWTSFEGFFGSKWQAKSTLKWPQNFLKTLTLKHPIGFYLIVFTQIAWIETAYWKWCPWSCDVSKRKIHMQYYHIWQEMGSVKKNHWPRVVKISGTPCIKSQNFSLEQPQSIRVHSTSLCIEILWHPSLGFFWYICEQSLLNVFIAVQ